MSFHTDHYRELENDRGVATYWDSDMDADDPGVKFKDVNKAADYGDTVGFLDKYLKGNTLLGGMQEDERNTQKQREEAREISKLWQSGNLGENLSYLAQTGEDQPIFIGGGDAGGGGGQQQSTLGRTASGAMTGAKIASIVPGIGTGVGAAVGAGLGALGIL